MLLDGLAASAIPICYGKRLARIEQDERGVTAYFSDGTVASGDVLVGADGIRSTVRQWILPNAPEPSFTGLIGAGGFLPRSTMLRLVGAENEHTMALCYGNRAFVGYALGDQREEMGAYWWHALAREKPPYAAERHALSGEQGVDALLKVDGGWSETVRAILTATTTHIPPLDLFDVPGLRRWSAGRVVLVGDAAHAVSPHSGQGASMALEDSIVLARQLTHRDVSLEAALDAYEDARRPRAERVVAMGRRSGNQKRRGPFSSALQMLLMPLVLRLMPAPHWLYGHEEAWT